MSDKDIDILGTQAKAIPGWETRAEDLARPDLFKVNINPNAYLLSHLTADEKTRLFKKLRLVASAARYMAAGMLKGTIKYTTDAYPVQQWFSHTIGEGADKFNYDLLLYQAWQEEQEKVELPTSDHPDVLTHPVGQDESGLAPTFQGAVKEAHGAPITSAIPEDAARREELPRRDIPIQEHKSSDIGKVEYGEGDADLIPKDDGRGNN